MLNPLFAQSNATPYTQFVTVDPRTMRRTDFAPTETQSSYEPQDDGDRRERDPLSLASPFCNPDF